MLMDSALCIMSGRLFQVIGCEARLRNDLYCVEWGVKLYSNQPSCWTGECEGALAELEPSAWNNEVAP